LPTKGALNSPLFPGQKSRYRAHSQQPKSVEEGGAKMAEFPRRAGVFMNHGFEEGKIVKISITIVGYYT